MCVLACNAADKYQCVSDHCIGVCKKCDGTMDRWDYFLETSCCTYQRTLAIVSVGQRPLSRDLFIYFSKSGRGFGHFEKITPLNSDPNAVSEMSGHKCDIDPQNFRAVDQAF